MSPPAWLFPGRSPGQHCPVPLHSSEQAQRLASTVSHGAASISHFVTSELEGRRRSSFPKPAHSADLAALCWRQLDPRRPVQRSRLTMWAPGPPGSRGEKEHCPERAADQSLSTQSLKNEKKKKISVIEGAQRPRPLACSGHLDSCAGLQSWRKHRENPTVPNSAEPV